MEAEGSYVDPYRRHDARWFSTLTPTDLVCDGGKESKVPPSEAPHAGSLEPLDQSAASSDDFAHGDKDDRAGPGHGVDALRDVFVESGRD